MSEFPALESGTFPDHQQLFCNMFYFGGIFMGQEMFLDILCIIHSRMSVTIINAPESFANICKNANLQIKMFCNVYRYISRKSKEPKSAKNNTFLPIFNLVWGTFCHLGHFTFFWIIIVCNTPHYLLHQNNSLHFEGVCVPFAIVAFGHFRIKLLLRYCNIILFSIFDC